MNMAIDLAIYPAPVRLNARDGLTRPRPVASVGHEKANATKGFYG
jgi:hypothetical protein